MSDFDDLMQCIEDEAQAEGPDAVAELRALDMRFWIASACLDARRQAHITQRELAAVSGVQQPEIPKIERGEITLGITTVDRLLRHSAGGLRFTPPNNWVKRVRPAPQTQIEWSWEEYETQLNIPTRRIEVGRELVERISAAIQARELGWQPMFRKGYVAFQRYGGYNVAIVDVYWSGRPRFAIKLPAAPPTLAIESPYPQLEDAWNETEREWWWIVPTLADIPDVAAAIELARPYQPASGPMTLP